MDELIESSHSNVRKYTMSVDANTEQRQKYNTLMSRLIIKHFKSNFLLIVSLIALKIAGNFCCDLWNACLLRTSWLSSPSSLISDSRWDCRVLFPHHSAPGRAITAHAQDRASACLLSPGLLIICLTAPWGAPCESGWLRGRRGGEEPTGEFPVANHVYSANLRLQKVVPAAGGPAETPAAATCTTELEGSEDTGNWWKTWMAPSSGKWWLLGWAHDLRQSSSHQQILSASVLAGLLT